MYEAIPEQSPNIMMDIINKAIHLVTVMYMAVCKVKGLCHLLKPNSTVDSYQFNLHTFELMLLLTNFYLDFKNRKIQSSPVEYYCKGR